VGSMLGVDVNLKVPKGVRIGRKSGGAVDRSVKK
jgi:hypothetical protein